MYVRPERLDTVRSDREIAEEAPGWPQRAADPLLPRCSHPRSTHTPARACARPRPRGWRRQRPRWRWWHRPSQRPHRSAEPRDMGAFPACAAPVGGSAQPRTPASDAPGPARPDPESSPSLARAARRCLDSPRRRKRSGAPRPPPRRWRRAPRQRQQARRRQLALQLRGRRRRKRSRQANSHPHWGKSPRTGKRSTRSTRGS